MESLNRRKIFALIAGCLVVGMIGGIIVWLLLPAKIQEEVISIEKIEAGEVRIDGPGDSIFSFESDGYWWPGRTVEKWIEVKNIGTLPLDFYISAKGHDSPYYDPRGDGANVSLEISWPNWEDYDGKDHGIWHIDPGSKQKVLIRVHMPYDADNTCQGNIWKIILTFHATQCSNK